MWDEWSYSVIASGDTVNVNGQYDEDIIMSGTQVAASFICPRRTVLDERLKNNEYSTAALHGTLRHQIFQDELTNDNPTINFLECYIKVVLRRNVESLFACGVNEKDVCKIMIDGIPKLYNWNMLFKTMKERREL
ncbi:hypothetical protein RYX36_025644 [Vicia faba]